MTYSKSQLNKIDVLLKLFEKEQVGIREGSVIGMMKGKNIEVSESEMRRFINQLDEDGYIFLKDDLYIITIKGMIYRGYTKDFKASRVSRRVSRFHNWTLAIGTALAGLYGLYEIMKWLDHRFFCWHFFF